MKALFAAALVASTAFAADPADAGTDAPLEVVDVERAIATTPDGGTIALVGGCWLSTPKCVATAKELSRDQVMIPVLEQPPPAPPVAIIIALALGVVLGVVGTEAISHLVK